MSYSVEPIGTLDCPQYYRYQQPRQGSYADNKGVITLNAGQNFEMALQDLDGFSHIWVVYLFHLNQTWRPLVNPPVNPDGKKKGLFATRSPHRPNRIGMSAVKLLSVDSSKRAITIGNFDLLDKTPILDIKPYLTTADLHPDATLGWLPTELDYWKLHFSTTSEEQCAWILAQCQFDIKEFCQVQLSLDPVNGQRKRVQKSPSGGWIIAFRTWRIHFELDETTRAIRIHTLTSGYSAEDLRESTDPYSDKEFHRLFILQWSL